MNEAEHFHPKIKAIIKQGEGVTVEFKECNTTLNKNVYETVCAFSNRHGGHLILGVKDNGMITGISKDHCPKIITDFVTLLNNPQKINPPLYLSPAPVEIDGKTVIVIHVPESPQVHSLNGRIFDRNADGDFDITRYTDRVATLFLRQQKIYTENTVYPFATLIDLRPDIIRRARMRAASRQEAPHAWTLLGDEELLRSAGRTLQERHSDRQGGAYAGCDSAFRQG